MGRPPCKSTLGMHYIISRSGWAMGSFTPRTNSAADKGVLYLIAPVERFARIAGCIRRRVCESFRTGCVQLLGVQSFASNMFFDVSRPRQSLSSCFMAVIFHDSNGR